MSAIRTATNHATRERGAAAVEHLGTRVIAIGTVLALIAAFKNWDFGTKIWGSSHFGVWVSG